MIYRLLYTLYSHDTHLHVPAAAGEHAAVVEDLVLADVRRGAAVFGLRVGRRLRGAARRLRHAAVEQLDITRDAAFW